MQLKAEKISNIVAQSAEHELTVHGIRMHDKVLVLDLCDINHTLRPEQLHVAPLHEVEALQPLSKINPILRRKISAKIWHSIAQALKYFVREDVGFCNLNPDNIYLNASSNNIYIAGWGSTSTQNNKESRLFDKSDQPSMERFYLAQLALLYYFIESGKNLHKELQNVGQTAWRDKHLKSAVLALETDQQLKDSLLMASGMGEGAYTNINAFIISIKSYFYLPDPEGVLPFLAGLWMGFSATVSLTFSMLIFYYGVALI